jgi:uncharacterized protein
MLDTFPRTHRTSATRDRGRVAYQRAAAYAIVDEALYCHLGFVVPDPGTGAPEPRMLPMVHVRLADTLYLHGSTGARALLAARDEGLAVCIAVTHLDGLVLARAQANHSANYRSVIAHGRARLVTDEVEKSRVLTALIERVAPGRASDSRPPTKRELSETAVLAVPLTEVSIKARVGPANDDAEDLALPHWAGVVPLRLTPGYPEPDTGVTAPVPGYLQRIRSPWLTPVPLYGDHVILEPLDLSHVEGLFAAVADDEVYRWLPRPRPATVADMAGQVRESLRQRQLGERLPFVQRSARTGEIVGTTSFYGMDEVNRCIAIGFTMLGQRWWRTGINTEAKLLLLRRAFDDLGAVRVEWHTDLCNERSQRAIERLGATREGVMRRQRLRPDGTWRDTVLYSMTDDEWPAVQARLQAKLRPAAPPRPA